MKKIIALTITVFALSFIFPNLALAQGMMGDDHTAREEAEGKVVFEKLQAKQTQCSELSTDDFGVLGEYFMGQMLGTSHEAMNNQMMQMMGTEGEEQMHVVMGKRMSECDTSVSFPMQGAGFAPMMMGGWSAHHSQFGGWGVVSMILWWALIIVGLVTVIKWLTGGCGESCCSVCGEKKVKPIQKKKSKSKKRA